jgi:hypothetical protein
LNLRKFNIGIDENPNLSSIKDYWDEHTMTKIQAMLQEYEDIFPTNLSKLKGINGDLGR